MPFNRRAWAEGWLSGIARGVQHGTVPEETLVSAAARALAAGLSADEIVGVIRSATELKDASAGKTTAGTLGKQQFTGLPVNRP